MRIGGICTALSDGLEMGRSVPVCAYNRTIGAPCPRSGKTISVYVGLHHFASRQRIQRSFMCLIGLYHIPFRAIVSS
jgi:hypothetical protein